MKKLLLAAALSAASMANAQQFSLERLSETEVTPPSARVEGPPGQMRITTRGCPSLPRDDMRRRIVDIAVQEWGFFGFTVHDETKEDEETDEQRRERRGRSWLDPVQSARVAESIAGYWAVTSDGGWILSRQNDVWQGPYGVSARWRDPWSAAFVSWVMCEGGLGELDEFHRHIAHHKYIDQAIVARSNDVSDAAYVAYDVGEQPIEPGDLLCSARRGVYRTLEERERDLGEGIRTHCDIAMKLDPANDRILGIGGNVRGSVSLKLLPAVFTDSGVESIGRDGDRVFAHLKLRADSLEGDALETSPTLRVLSEQEDGLALVEQRLEGET